VKRIAIALVTVVALTGAVNAAPTCHQKIALSGTEFSTPVYKLKDKVKKMVKTQALDMISSSDADRDNKAKAYVYEVSTVTAKLLKATITDDFRDMASNVVDSIVTGYDNLDKYTKDEVARNNAKAYNLDSAAQTVITGFFACK
jgi:hypothetical protein